MFLVLNCLLKLAPWNAAPFAILRKTYISPQVSLVCLTEDSCFVSVYVERNLVTVTSFVHRGNFTKMEWNVLSNGVSYSRLDHGSSCTAASQNDRRDILLEIVQEKLWFCKAQKLTNHS